MDKDQVIQLIHSEIDKGQSSAQFAPSKVPVHYHNGLDSPRVDYGNLNNRNLFITSHVAGTSAASTFNYGHFFLNPLNYNANTNTITNTTSGMKIMVITEVHGVAGSDSGSVLLNVVRLGQFFPSIGFYLMPVTAPFGGGETSATLVTAWPYPSVNLSTVFSNGDVRTVTYTNSSTSISWTGALSGAATVVLEIFKAPLEVITQFNLKLSADVPRYAASSLGKNPAILYPGERLALQTSGILTNVEDVLVTVQLQY